MSECIDMTSKLRNRFYTDKTNFKSSETSISTINNEVMKLLSKRDYKKLSFTVEEWCSFNNFRDIILHEGGKGGKIAVTNKND